MNTSQPAPATVSTKRRLNSYSSESSTPMRCLTVSGQDVAPRTARPASATCSGPLLWQARQPQTCTQSDGNLQFRLISPYTTDSTLAPPLNADPRVGKERYGT